MSSNERSRTSSNSQFGGAVDPPSQVAAAGVVGADASSESKSQELVLMVVNYNKVIYGGYQRIITQNIFTEAGIRFTKISQ